MSISPIAFGALYHPTNRCLRAAKYCGYFFQCRPVLPHGKRHWAIYLTHVMILAISMAPKHFRVVVVPSVCGPLQVANRIVTAVGVLVINNLAALWRSYKCRRDKSVDLNRYLLAVSKKRAGWITLDQAAWNAPWGVADLPGQVNLVKSCPRAQFYWMPHFNIIVSHKILLFNMGV